MVGQPKVSFPVLTNSTLLQQISFSEKFLDVRLEQCKLPTTPPATERESKRIIAIDKYRSWDAGYFHATFSCLTWDRAERCGHECAERAWEGCAGLTP